MTTPTDYRAVLADLIDAGDELCCLVEAIRDGSYTADSFTTQPMKIAMDAVESALLAAPEAVGVADEEWDALVERLWDQYETVGYQGERFMHCSDFGTAMDLARKELTRVTHPAPVPVGERLPDRSDCDAQGRVWWLIQNASKPIPTWALGTYRIGKSDWEHTHWLPHWALPLPGVGDQFFDMTSLRHEIEQLLNQARCLERRRVGNAELTDRILDAIFRWALPLPGDQP